MRSRVRSWWVVGTIGLVALLLGVGAPLIAWSSQTITGREQTQIRRAIAADIGYRNGRMVTTAPSSSFRAPAFPAQVTAAEKARLGHAPAAGSVPDTFVDFRTSIAVTSMSRKGDGVVVDFTETTTMPRPQALPVYGYSTPQAATLVERGGVWLVEAIAFAPGSGLDGADCSPGRWAGAC